MNVKWTDEGLASLEEIGDYIAQFNPARASSFMAEIKSKTDVLGKQPAAFKSGRIQGTREFVVHKNYVVVYRVNDLTQVVDILFVHHTARLFPAPW
jgi:toxin ParE1/3/4